MCTRRLSGLCLCEILEARRGMASQTTCLLILLIIASANVSSYSPYNPIVLPNLSLTATEGSCVEIKCTVTGTLADEDALWFWMKDGKWNETEKDFTGTIVYSNKITERPISPSFEGRVNYTGSQRLTRPTGSYNYPRCSILICDLKIEDSGTYFFRYMPKDPTQKWKTADVVLTVQENPCPITFNKPKPVKASSTITLQCSTVGPCSSDLYIESVLPSGFETLTSTSDQRSATLSFRASWEDDGREFICQTKWNKDIHLAKKTTVTVQYAPSVEVKVFSPSSSFTQGRTVTLTCEVIRSNPPPDVYTWFKNGNSLSSGQTYNKTLQPEDSGSYTCSATNNVTVGRSSPLQINVLYPPSQVTLTMDTEVIEGQRITITCSVDSSPKSHLILNRTSGTNLLEKLQEVTDNNTLSYTFSVTSAHAGVYTCHAQNHLGSNSTQRQLQVKYCPKHVTVQADPGLDVKENMRLRLSCSAQSNPPVTSVTWTINGRNLTQHKGSTFTVKSVTPNDSGLYSCTAYNDIGKGQSQPVEVKVKFAPKHIKVLRAVEAQTSDGKRSVTLSCSSHSYPPVSQFTWYRKTDDRNADEVSKNMNYTVLSSQPGVYYCTARNEISEKTSEPVRLFLDGGYVKFIFLALVLLLIVLVAVFVFRLKRKKSIEEVSATSSWSFSWFKGGWTDARGRTEPGQTKPCRNNPGPQQPPEITNGTSSINPVYSTVHLPKDNLGQRATREQHGQDHSLNYASLHFKKKTSMPPKPTADVVYSTVKTPKEEMSDVYENVKTVQRCPNLMLSYSDSSEDEVDVSYTQVNFRNKARGREAPGLSAEEEAQYSELKF